MDARSTKNRLGPLIWRCRCLISRKGANVLKNENAGEDLDGLRCLESCSLDKRPGGTSAGDGRQGKIPWSSDSSNPVEYSGEIFIKVEICHDRRDRWSCKICASCVIFSRKRVFSQNLRRSTRLNRSSVILH